MSPSHDEGEADMIGPDPDAAAIGLSPLVALVYLTDTATPEDRAAVRDYLEADPAVVSVEYQDGTQSFEEARRRFARNPELIRDGRTSPAPTFFKCTLLDSNSSTETVHSLGSELPGIYGVTIEPPPRDGPQYRIAWMERYAARRASGDGHA